MNESDFVDHVMQVHEDQRPERKEWERVVQEALAEIQVEEDIAKVTKVLVDLKTFGALQENPDQVTSPKVSTAAKANELLHTTHPKLASIYILPAPQPKSLANPTSTPPPPPSSQE
ncbi:hypothetical protein JHK85_004921 [Glycine max]|nr:hypothetical protein JHK87_004587 [Glycine soja]KAG5063738.1 hypothetical protein JHK85_004921 [Glycine max]KAG5080690.1 hypothetical protein JHK86_004755 [Glycine max]